MLHVAWLALCLLLALLIDGGCFFLRRARSRITNPSVFTLGFRRNFRWTVAGLLGRHPILDEPCISVHSALLLVLVLSRQVRRGIREKLAHFQTLLFGCRLYSLLGVLRESFLSVGSTVFN